MLYKHSTKFLTILIIGDVAARKYRLEVYSDHLRERCLILEVAREWDLGGRVIINWDLCFGGPASVSTIIFPFNINLISGEVSGFYGSASPWSSPSVWHVATLEGDGGRDCVAWIQSYTKKGSISGLLNVWESWRRTDVVNGEQFHLLLGDFKFGIFVHIVIA